MKDINAFSEWAGEMWWSNRGDEGTSQYASLRQLFIMAQGLNEEAGEVAGILKKHIRDDFLDRDHLVKELGDVINYWTAICRRYEILPSEVLAANMDKLQSRKARGTQRGSGDNR